MAGDVWPIIHAERKSLAADLDGISEDAWNTTSLCTQWTVRDVVAHMTATGRMSSASFFPKLIASGFSLARLQRKDIERERGSSVAQTLTGFKSIVDSKGRPPGPPETMLGEIIVHSEDIRRPLGIKHEYPADAATRVAEFYRRSNLIIGGKRRVTGLTLDATDTEWRAGDGPVVSGPIVSLVLAITGRPAAFTDLQGDGVSTLRERS